MILLYRCLELQTTKQLFLMVVSIGRFQILNKMGVSPNIHPLKNWLALGFQEDTIRPAGDFWATFLFAKVIDCASWRRQKRRQNDWQTTRLSPGDFRGRLCHEMECGARPCIFGVCYICPQKKTNITKTGRLPSFLSHRQPGCFHGKRLFQIHLTKLLRHHFGLLWTWSCLQVMKEFLPKAIPGIGICTHFWQLVWGVKVLMDLLLMGAFIGGRFILGWHFGLEQPGVFLTAQVLLRSAKATPRSDLLGDLLWRIRRLRTG